MSLLDSMGGMTLDNSENIFSRYLVTADRHLVVNLLKEFERPCKMR